MVRWQAVKKNIDHMRFDRSPFVPTNIIEWLEHREALIQDGKKEQEEIMVQMQASRTKGYGSRSLHLVYPAFGGKRFSDGRSGVLAEPSVWVHLVGELKSTRVPWPSREELKEEGDERHTSGFGRFLPIPRVPGNETVAYKQCHFLLYSPLDYVKPVSCVHHSLLPEGYPNEYFDDHTSVLPIRRSPEFSQANTMSDQADDNVFDTKSEGDRVAYEWKHRHDMSRRPSSSVPDHEIPTTPEYDLATLVNKQAERIGLKLNVHATTFKVPVPKSNSVDEESPIKSSDFFLPPKTRSFHEDYAAVGVLNYDSDEDMDAHKIEPMLAPMA